MARWGSPFFAAGGRPTPAVKRLLVANVAAFVVQLFADPWTIRWFGLTPALVAQGEVWRTVTYMFLHGGVWHLAFNMLWLWVFGREVEEALGSVRFLFFYFFTGIGAGLCALALGWGGFVPVIGASGAVFGVLMAYAILNPHRPITLLVFLVLPVTMSARTLVAIVGGLQVLLLLQSGGRGLGELAHLGGLFFGWLALKWPAILAWIRLAERRREYSRQARVVTRRTAERRQLQDEVDRLLAKISRGGMESLTDRERKRLYEASERLRDL